MALVEYTAQSMPHSFPTQNSESVRSLLANKECVVPVRVEGAMLVQECPPWEDPKGHLVPVLYFTDEESEPQGSEMTCPGSHKPRRF